MSPSPAAMLHSDAGMLLLLLQALTSGRELIPFIFFCVCVCADQSQETLRRVRIYESSWQVEILIVYLFQSALTSTGFIQF